MERKLAMTNRKNKKHVEEIDSFLEEDKNRNKQTIGIVGLGYVGLPVAVGFAKAYHVIGFDVNQHKLEALQKNVDHTGEFSTEELKDADIHFTSKEQELCTCRYIIVTVPTPITSTNEPDLTFLKQASVMIGRNLTPGTIIVYESTVYPGTTEEICIPVLETDSNLKAGVDFHVGYSPERINPGDKEHTFTGNNKVISAQNAYALEKIASLYQSVLHAKLFKASSMKVAEACKIIENAQRDINIAFMNELSLIFNKLDIDTYEVLEAANTKWNFLPFTPGLVGGHCISVDPYYLIYKAKLAGYSSTFLSAARAINDDMPAYVVQSLLQLIIMRKLNVQNIRITVLGITFKENLPDIRNSKSIEIVDQLQQLGLNVQICDPYVTQEKLNKLDISSTIDLKAYDQLDKADIVIAAVPHQAFKLQNSDFLKELLPNNQGIIMDLKGVILKSSVPEDTTLWRL